MKQQPSNQAHADIYRTASFFQWGAAIATFIVAKVNMMAALTRRWAAALARRQPASLSTFMIICCLHWQVWQSFCIPASLEAEQASHCLKVAGILPFHLDPGCLFGLIWLWPLSAFHFLQSFAQAWHQLLYQWHRYGLFYIYAVLLKKNKKNKIWFMQILIKISLSTQRQCKKSVSPFLWRNQLLFQSCFTLQRSERVSCKPDPVTNGVCVFNEAAKSDVDFACTKRECTVCACVST